MQCRNVLSTAAQNALPSGVRRMFELAKKYNDSINLTAFSLKICWMLQHNELPSGHDLALP